MNRTIRILDDLKRPLILKHVVIGLTRMGEIITLVIKGQ
jgi:hypothetical protein